MSKFRIGEYIFNQNNPESCGRITGIYFTTGAVSYSVLRRDCNGTGYEDWIDERVATNNNPKVDFPNDFYHFGQSKDGYKVLNNEINEWILECIAHLKENPGEKATRSSGDSFVLVVEDDLGYEVYVMKNYWHKRIYTD